MTDKNKTEMAEAEVARLENILAIQTKQIERLWLARDALGTYAKRNRDALRALFYHRHTIGTKVEEEIAEEDQDLWRQCHAILNPPDNEPY